VCFLRTFKTVTLATLGEMGTSGSS
jgi:hypothetical protein